MSSVNQIHFLIGNYWDKDLAIKLAYFIVDLASDGISVNLQVYSNQVDVIDTDLTEKLTDKHCDLELLTLRVRRILMANVHKQDCAIISEVRNGYLYLDFYNKINVKC